LAISITEHLVIGVGQIAATELAFHALSYFSDELHTLLPELLKEQLPDIALITKEFPKQRACQLKQGTTVIDIAHCGFHSQQFALAIDDQV
jgi:hypothetical protein